jgi:hypothetical protein
MATPRFTTTSRGRVTHAAYAVCGSVGQLRSRLVVQILWLFVLSFFTIGSASAKPPSDPGTLVVDAKGQVVGRFWGPAQPVFVTREIDGNWVSVGLVVKNGFLSGGFNGAGVGFVSSDCTGPAYIFPFDGLIASAIFLPGVLITGTPSGTTSPTATLYYPSGSVLTLTINSVLSGDGVCDQTGPIKPVVSPALSTTLKVVPPLSIK